MYLIKLYLTTPFQAFIIRTGAVFAKKYETIMALKTTTNVPII